MQQTQQKARIVLSSLAIVLCLFILAGVGDRTCRAIRCRRVMGYALSASAEFGVLPALVLAVIETESDFKRLAVSEAGARGLMQLMPDTFRYLTDERLAEHLEDEMVFDARTNVRYGTCYLAYLFHRFGSWRVALAAYNAGEGRVAAWQNDKRYGKDLAEIPFPETEKYVTTVCSAYRRYTQKYNF